MIFHTSLDMMDVIRDLQSEGHTITATPAGPIFPYLTEPIKRFGEYPTDELHIISPPANAAQARSARATHTCAPS